MIGAIHPLQDFGVKILTAIIILLLTAINYRGVALGGKVQLVFTTLKVAALGFIVLCAFAIGNGSFANFSTDSINTNGSSAIPQGWDLLSAIVMALSGAFWAYDGWNNITYIAGEVKIPLKIFLKLYLLA